jgi:CRISPR-associated exonuclease Cas4
MSGDPWELPVAEDYPPIRALNDLLFCERRCALHRIEEVWCDNAHTVLGTAGHARAHRSPSRRERDAGGQEERNLWLLSHRLRIVGKADVVEFRPEPFPIEYKKGRRRRWDNDDVQLCAQALCLEEMRGAPVPAGAIYHLASRRRREVVFDTALRRRTEEAVRRLHELLAAAVTPPPILKPRCRGCSLRPLCMPEVLQQRQSVEAYCRRLYRIEADPG